MKFDAMVWVDCSLKSRSFRYSTVGIRHVLRNPRKSQHLDKSSGSCGKKERQYHKLKVLVHYCKPHETTGEAVKSGCACRHPWYPLTPVIPPDEAKQPPVRWTSFWILHSKKFAKALVVQLGQTSLFGNVKRFAKKLLTFQIGYNTTLKHSQCYK